MSRDGELPRSGLYSFRAWGRGHSLLYSAPFLQEPMAIEGKMAAWGKVGLKYSIHYYSITGRSTGQETDAIEKT